MPRKPSNDKPTLEEKRAVAPPSGVPVRPPEVAEVENSILNAAAPTLDEVALLKQNALSTFMENADVDHLERRITLLARMVIEDALWEMGKLSPKERADVALNAIRTFEGSKSKLWVEDPNAKDLPKNRQAMEAEKARIEKRLQGLLKRKSAASVETTEAALQVIEEEKKSESTGD